MSVATVVTRGFGSFGGVNKLPTLGYSIGAAAVVVNGPWCVEAAQARSAGAVVMQQRSGGAVARQVRAAGAVIQQAGCCR